MKEQEKHANFGRNSGEKKNAYNTHKTHEYIVFQLNWRYFVCPTQIRGLIEWREISIEFGVVKYLQKLVTCKLSILTMTQFPYEIGGSGQDFFMINAYLFIYHDLSSSYMT